MSLRVPESVKHLHWRVVEEGGARHQGEAFLPDAADAAVEIEGVRHREVEPVSRASPCRPATTGSSSTSSRGTRCSSPRPGSATCPSHSPHGERVWGPALQLYALRSQRNWGIGDFTDLGQVVDQWAARGASLVGVNPLHAMFAHDPWHASPYSPSSRQQLNTLYLDVEAIEDFDECEAARELVRAQEFQRRLAVLREAPMVDYAGVAQAKQEVLKLLHASFRQHHASGERAEDFRRFRAERGAALRRHASFEALQAHFHAIDPLVWGWPAWPLEYQDPTSAQVEAFVAEHEAEIEYHEYLQWQADRQLAAVAERCSERGLPLGLYLDLAVSVDRAGSDCWGNADVYAPDASVGAPPDELQPQRPGLGPAAAAPGPLPPQRPRALHPDAQGHDAPRRRLAHRPRDGPDAPVLGAARPLAARRRLCALSAAGADRDRGAGERARALPRDRRGPGHGARRGAPCDGERQAAVVSAAVLRARARRRLQAARRLPAPTRWWR